MRSWRPAWPPPPPPCVAPCLTFESPAARASPAPSSPSIKSAVPRLDSAFSIACPSFCLRAGSRRMRDHHEARDVVTSRLHQLDHDKVPHPEVSRVDRRRDERVGQLREHLVALRQDEPRVGGGADLELTSLPIDPILLEGQGACGP